MKNINNSLKTKQMKKLYEILFEGKKPEEQPLKLEIKLKSTATPKEQLEINEWYRHINNSLQRNQVRCVCGQ